MRKFTYGVGYSVVCLEWMAIPEPELAEQQDCSPAFLFAHIYANLDNKQQSEDAENPMKSRQK